MSEAVDLNELQSLLSRHGKKDLVTLMRDYDALQAEVERLKALIAEYDATDTSRLPYEKGWQDGRDDAWEAYCADSESLKANAHELAMIHIGDGDELGVLARKILARTTPGCRDSQGREP